MIKVKRQITSLKKGFDNDPGFMDASAEERISFMWELTQEIWSLKDKKGAQRRLQRHITALIKKPS